MYEVSKCAPQEALRDLDRAFTNFWRRRKKNQVGFPKFKKKGRNDSFRLYGSIRVFEKAVQLPRLGRIRVKEKPQIKGQILSATVSRRADRWFVSFCTEEEKITSSLADGPRIGVDLGITSLATLSDATVFDKPRALTKRLRKLKRLSRQLSCEEKGSNNRRKAILRLARLHWRISNIRLDVIHKVTSYLAKNHSQIIIEDLCIRVIMKNKLISRAIADVELSELCRQLVYKTKWYGLKLIIAHRSFPSSKRCSQCGKIKERLSLSERIFICESCGLQLNRDLNAARNLVTASWTETENACYEAGGYSSSGQCSSMKQELNFSQT